MTAANQPHMTAHQELKQSGNLVLTQTGRRNCEAPDGPQYMAEALCLAW